MKILISLFVFLVVGLSLAFIPIYRSTAETVTFTVKDKPERIISSAESGYSNLVYTDKGVFTNNDTLSFFKFRSSDVYNQLEEGKTYTCKVAGWRIGFFSSYKNIIDCEGFVY